MATEFMFHNVASNLGDLREQNDRGTYYIGDSPVWGEYNIYTEVHLLLAQVAGWNALQVSWKDSSCPGLFRHR